MADDKASPSKIDAFLDSIITAITGFIAPEKESKPHLSWWVSYLSGWNISRGTLLVIGFFAVHTAAAVLFMPYLQLVWGWLLMGMPLILTVGLARTFWAFWKWYITTHYIFTRTNPTLLEVRMPTEVMKSPRAMEQVLSTIWISSGESTFINKYWEGGVRPYFSFEIVSFGGQIRFYIWCRGNTRNMVEAAMYAQYPEVEIVQVEDYAQKFNFDPRKHFTFWSEYKYHVDDVLPIKTYIDFELDQDPKEEFKVEPFAQVLETLGALKEGEQGWLQICFRLMNSGEIKAWISDVQHKVDEIRKKMSLGEGDDTARGFPRPTWSQQEQMKTMERNMGKLPFTVGIRSAYIAPQGKARSVELSAIRMIFRPFFNVGYANEIRPARGDNAFDFPWQDYMGIRKNLMSNRFLDAYRRRLFWHPPWVLPTMRMTSEVLATIWHPPSRTVATPGLIRIPTSKAEPPPNLPL